MSENKVRLKTGFRIAHGELEEIIANIIKSGVNYNCIDCSALFKASADPNQKVEDSSKTHLRKHDLVEEDGTVPVAVRHVIISAAGYTSEEEARASGQTSCTSLNLSNLIAE